MVAVLSLLIASATAFAIPATSINKPQLPLQSSRPSSPIAGAAPKYPRVLLCAAAPPPPTPPPSRVMLPISLAVFVQMLGVGVTLATLPLMMATQGYSPNQLGVTISCFSAAQMIGCPFLVSLSNKAGIGRLAVLRACLGGNALAAILTAASRSWGQITIARILAGFFAASVPVAQVAAADVSEPGPQTSKAISRVSSAASLGMIVGPAFGGLAAELSRRLFNVPPSLESRCAFAVSGVFAAIVLVLTAGVRLPGAKTSAVVSSGSSSSGSSEEMSSSSSSDEDSSAGAVAAAEAEEGGEDDVWFGQPLVRWIAVACSYSVVTTVAVYALFTTTFLGYGQADISLSQSAAAAAALVAQLLVLPRMIDFVGEAVSCAVGLTLLGLCIGGSALIRLQPFHFFLFVFARAGHALAEVSNAGLTARISNPIKRARNLALLQSFQSGSRLFSPLIASYLYTLSLKRGVGLGPPGALPFFIVAMLALLSVPMPLLLHSRTRAKSG